MVRKDFMDALHKISGLASYAWGDEEGGYPGKSAGVAICALLDTIGFLTMECADNLFDEEADA